MLLDQSKTVFPGIVGVLGWPAVNDNGQFVPACQFHLLNKNFLLNFAWRMVVVVIEANFTPGNDFGLPRELLEFYEIRFFRQLGLVRMDADCRVQEFVLVGEFHGAVQSSGTVAGTDGEDVDYS